MSELQPETEQPTPPQLLFEEGPPPSQAYIVIDFVVGALVALWAAWLAYEWYSYKTLAASCAGGGCSRLFREYLVRALFIPGGVVGFLAAARASLGSGEARTSTKVVPEWAITVPCTIAALFVGKFFAIWRTCEGADAEGALCRIVSSAEATMGAVLMPSFIYFVFLWTIGQRRQRASKFTPLAPTKQDQIAKELTANRPAAAAKIAPPSKGSAPMRPVGAPPPPGAKKTAAPAAPAKATGSAAPGKPARQGGPGFKNADGVRMIEYDEDGNLANSTSLPSVTYGLVLRCWVVWLAALLIAVALNYFSCRGANVSLGSFGNASCGGTAALSVLWLGVLIPVPLMFTLWGVARLIALAGPVSRTIAQSVAPLEFAAESVPLGLFSGIWLLICVLLLADWALPGVLSSGAARLPSRVTWRGSVGRIVGGESVDIPAAFAASVFEGKVAGLFQRSGEKPILLGTSGRVTDSSIYLRGAGSRGMCVEWMRASGTIMGENLGLSSLSLGCSGLHSARFTGNVEQDKGDDLFSR